MAIVTTDNKHYQAIADKVRELKGTTETMTPSEMPSKVQSVYDAGYEKGKAEGGDSEKLKEWMSCGLLFDFRNYTGTSIDVESSLALAYSTVAQHAQISSTNSICSGNENIKECRIIFPKATTARYSFYDCHNLEYLTVDMTKVVDATNGYTGFNSTFRNCYSLKRIDGQISLLNCVPENTFTGCRALEYVAFLPNSINKSLSLSSSSNFSAEGIQTLINALVTITDGVARTITFHADVKAKLTDEQKATITTTKGWTLA